MLQFLNQSILATTTSFTPKHLFAAGEQVVWYDPSDMATLFQDSAGTTPVTAVEQPVGLVLDKSKGLSIGPDLVTNGAFATDTAWTNGANWTISGGAANCNNPVSGGYNALSQNMGLVAGTTYILTFDITVTSGKLYDIRAGGSTAGFVVIGNISTSGSKSYYIQPTGANGTLYFYSDSAGFVGSIDNVVVRAISGNHASQSTAANRPVLSARYNLLLATETLATQNVTTVATNYTLAFSGAGSITLSGTKTGTYTAGTNTLTGVTAGTLTLTVSGSVTQADLRPANDGIGLPAYQRVTTSTDYDTAGFPAYLKFDGVDDQLTTTFASSVTGSMLFAYVEGILHAECYIPAGAWTYPQTATYLLSKKDNEEIIINKVLSGSVLNNTINYLSKGIGGDGKFASLTTMANAFRGRTDITKIYVGDWDTSKVTSFSAFAYGCTNLTTLNVSGWDTSKVTSFSAFAINCSSLTALDVSGWNTSKVTNFSNFVQGCTNLTTLNVSGWDTSKVTSFYAFAVSCSSLTALDISGWNTGLVTSFQSFVQSCANLTTLTVGTVFNASPCTDYTSAFASCALNQASVDSILVSINAAGTSNGTLGISGGTNATPSATGQTATDALRARGWTVTLNGY